MINFPVKIIINVSFEEHSDTMPVAACVDLAIFCRVSKNFTQNFLEKLEKICADLQVPFGWPKYRWAIYLFYFCPAVSTNL